MIERVDGLADPRLAAYSASKGAVIQLTKVLAVEWAERLSFVPWPRVWRVALEHAGEDARRLTVTEEVP